MINNVIIWFIVFAIRVYQLTWSRLHGRTCLFQPTCSCQAIHYLRERGLSNGIRSIRARLNSCNANYSLRLVDAETVELMTSDGTVVPDAEINPAIKAKLLAFSTADRAC